MSHIDGTRGESDEVDRLVDAGLERYSAGDIEGALRAWEQALQIDPDESRAAGYVDYVREHYELLAGAPRGGDADVPFGLSAVPGDGASHSDDDDYEVEITAGPPAPDEVPEASDSMIERYIESVDEGWFLQEGVAPAVQVFAPPPEPVTPLRPQRTSQPPRVQLPLPANATADDDAARREIDAGEPAVERTDLGRESEFVDQRSAAPTQEIHAPRGFVRSLVPVDAKSDEETGGFDADDDRLRTRPGRSAGSPLDLAEIPQGLAAEALGALTPESGMRPHGPEESTLESPFVRVTFNSDAPEMPELGEDERTSERRALRLDTMSEPTSERREFTPEPLDAPAGRAPSGEHPPLVIVEGGTPTLDFGEPGSEMPPTAESRPRKTLEGIGPVSAPPVLPTAPIGLDDLSAAAVRARRASTSPANLPSATLTPTEELAAQLDAELEAGAIAGEAGAEKTRRRVSHLIERAMTASEGGDHATAIVALDLALREDPESAVAQKLIHRHQPAILDVYQRYLGNLGNRPGLAMPMHELSGEKLDIRAAFLLSRVDGALSFEEILDVSGMQRAEAFRHLANLVLRGILTVG